MVDAFKATAFKLHSVWHERLPSASVIRLEDMRGAKHGADSEKNIGSIVVQREPS